MRRETAAALALVACLGWFAWGGPRTAEALEQVRVERQVLPTPREVAQRAADPAVGDDRRDRLLAFQAALEQSLAAELKWNRVIAGIVDPGRRAKGLELAARAAENPPRPGMRGLDGDIIALVVTLQEQHGWVGPPATPAAAAKDDWNGIDRRGRARVAQALAAAGELSDDEAGELLDASLELLDAQGEVVRTQAAAAW